VLLLAVIAAQLLYAAHVASATDDEPYCIVSGLTALRTGDYRFNVDHPPLMGMVLGAAAHLAGAAPLPFNQDWQQGLRLKYCYFYLWTGPNAPKAVALVTAARLPVIALSLGLALLVFVWARQLYGWKGALLSLALYSFEPNIIAHSSLATLDFGLTAAFCFAVYAFWRHWRTGRFLYLVLTGIALGAAATIKLPGLLLLLVLPVLMFAARREERPLTTRAAAGSLAAIFGVALVFMWAVYRFTVAPISSAPGALRVPLGQYWQAIAFQIGHQGSGHPAFLLGMASTSGWWYYYLVAFLVKTSLPLLFLFGLALSRGRLDQDERFLVIPAAAMLAAALIQNLDLGIRYILPLYPLLIILVGRTLTRPWPEGWGAWPRRAALALTLWAAAEAAIYAPNYLAYFNELVGGPSHGGAVLADSNLDWGQDLRSLAAWQGKHPEASPLHFAYFGPADVSRYGVRCERLPDLGPKDPPRPREWYARESRPRTGWIAVSVNCLKLMSPYRWLESYQPVDRAGYSILIYHITAANEGGGKSRAGTTTGGGPSAAPLPQRRAGVPRPAMPTGMAARRA
jgi:4-amino-4-deoxy-L-arabinose transferase-like glycosyltransferase